MILLTPLYQTALEIGLRLKQRAHLDIIDKNTINQKTIDKVVALVQIYCTHHCLESIAIDMFLRKVIR